MNPQYALLDGGPADGTRVPITDPTDPYVVREAGVDHTYEPAVGPIADRWTQSGTALYTWCRPTNPNQETHR